MVGVLITNGGPHSAGDWAIFATEQIVQIADTASGTSASAARKLENNIIDYLEAHFVTIQNEERAAIAADSSALLTVPAGDELTATWATDIAAIASTTEFAPHFGNPEIQAYITDTVKRMALSVIDVERSWYCDAHADDPHAQSYRASRPF